MAVQIESPGQIQEFLEILKGRKWQILLPTLMFLALGIASAVIVPKKYMVTTQVELRELFLDDDQRIAARAQTQGVAENAPQQIKSMRRITEVLDNLKWPDYLTLGPIGQAEYRTRIQENITVSVPRKGREVGSSFVTIEYLDVNKDRAVVFLKKLRTAWEEQVVERERVRIDIEYRKLLEREVDLDREWVKVHQQRSDLRTANDLSPTQPTPGANQQRLEDPQVLRYNQNKGRADEVDVLLKTAETRLGLARAQLAKTDPVIPKTKVVEGVSFDTQIEGLRTQQLVKEQQIELKSPDHPIYRKVQRELEMLEDRIQELEQRQTSSEEQLGFEPNPDYLALEKIVRDLELNTGTLGAEQEVLRKALLVNRDEIRRLNEASSEDSQLSGRLSVLQLAMGEIETEVQMKKQRLDVVYGPGGNPFQVIQEVETPGDASEPDPLLILAFSLVLGLAVGFGTALLGEFSKSCFRSTSDISRVMVVPVLGSISPIVTRMQRRRRTLRRFLVGSMSMLLIASVLFVTWAWSTQPNILGDRMNDSIERLRSAFL